MPISSSKVPLSPPPQATSSSASSSGTTILPFIASLLFQPVECLFAEHRRAPVPVADDRVALQAHGDRGAAAALGHAGDAEAAVERHRTRAVACAQHLLRGGGIERPEVQFLLVVHLHADLLPRAGNRLRGKRENT